MVAAVVASDRLPIYLSDRHVAWLVNDDLEITLNRDTGLYAATYMIWDEEAQDWKDDLTVGPGEALRLACEHELIITS